MANLTFCQELVKTAVQTFSIAIAGGLSVFLGWLLLRHEERVKHSEALNAEMRRLRQDALVKSLEAIGRYHNLKTRRLVFSDPAYRGTHNPAEIQTIFQQEKQAFEHANDTMAALEFLLGESGATLGGPLKQLGAASSIREIEDVVSQLHADLRKQIPALE